MSEFQLNRVNKILENQTFHYLNEKEILKEKPGIPKEELDNILHSQAYLLYALKSITGEQYEELSQFITDGFSDNGLDLVYYSIPSNELLICQSKWIKKGKGGVDKGEILKFINGVDDLLKLNFEAFNDKLKKHSKIFEKAILSSNIKIKLILAHSGDRTSNENLKIIKDKLDEFNDVDEDIFFKEFNLKDAYTYLKDSIEGEPINAEVDLFDWGYFDEPYKSYYGIMSCGQVAELISTENSRIFSKNIRSFIGFSGINKEITNTLIDEPEKFFYLNNGIILICKEVKKSPYNSGRREIGEFHLKDLTVVNGAQTVGAINFAFTKQPEKVNTAKVFVKIISLEGTPGNFDKNITVASNTQNKIEKRDFISLDGQQKRLKNEFYLSGFNYHIKRDDKELIKDKKNFYFEETTISLACLKDDSRFSTYAKREIGKLWEDRNYDKIFNSQLNINQIINSVLVFREIERSLKLYQSREKLILSHGVYLLGYLIFQKLKDQGIMAPTFNISKYLEQNFKKDFFLYSKRLITAYEDVSPDNKFPLAIFKNFKLCETMKSKVLQQEGIVQPGQSYTLFDKI